MNGRQITALLSNADLDRLERLRLQPVRRMTNRSRGEHFAGKGGTSTEFCDYRDYAAGDDTRFVDWNIFSRLQRPYLKIFHQEEELHVVILVDASSSMLFEEKLTRAKQIAAAFGILGLRNGERVSVHAFQGSGKTARLTPCRGRQSIRKLLAFAEGIEGGGEAPIEAGIAAMLKNHSGRGAAILLSDFLTTGDMRRPFNFLSSAGLEIFALQILGPTEIDPGLTGDVRLVDSETEETVDISSASDLLALYQEYRAGLAENLANLCRQRAGRFLSISSADPIDWVLFDLLRRKGWIL